jgi:hypothetical protein
MMMCYRTYLNSLKIGYQTKTNKEMSQDDFQFFCKSNDFFLVGLLQSALHMPLYFFHQHSFEPSRLLTTFVPY